MEDFFMKRFMMLLTWLIFITNILNSKLYTQEVTDEIKIGEVIKISSKVLNEDRNIFIYLPAGYENSEERYPVLYLLDGGGHFHHGSGIVQFMSLNGLMPQTIVVAIPNTARNRDFTPTVDKGMRVAGGADNFLDFLQNELIPMIDAKYRTHKYRILFGHSLTAMFTAYTLATHPTLFDAYIAASPYLQYDDEITIKKTKELCTPESLKNKILYITVGDEPPYFASLDKYSKFLNSLDTREFQFKYEIMKTDNHMSIPHKTIYQGLEFIFDGWQIPAEKATSLASIQEHYRNLTDKFGFIIKPSEFLLNRLGYEYLGKADYENAIDVFKTNVELYPNSDNVYDSLGEAYEKSGKLKLAVASYKIAVEKGTTAQSRNLEIYKKNLKRVQDQLN